MTFHPKKNTAAVYHTGALTGKPYDNDMGNACESKYFYIKVTEGKEVLWYMGVGTSCCDNQEFAKYYFDRKTAQKIANELQEKREGCKASVFSSAVVV